MVCSIGGPNLQERFKKGKLVMPCVHVKKLYELCQQHELRFQLSGSELIRIVCRECGEQEVCPSVLTDEYEARESQEDNNANRSAQ